MDSIPPDYVLDSRTVSALVAVSPIFLMLNLMFLLILLRFRKKNN